MDLGRHSGNAFREHPQSCGTRAGGYSGNGFHCQGAWRAGAPLPDGHPSVFGKHSGCRPGGRNRQQPVPHNAQTAGRGGGQRSQRPYGRIHQPALQYGQQSAGFPHQCQLHRYPVLGHPAGPGTQTGGIAGHHPGSLGLRGCSGANGEMDYPVRSLRYHGSGVLCRLREWPGDLYHLRETGASAGRLHAVQYPGPKPFVVLYRHT